MGTDGTSIRRNKYGWILEIQLDGEPIHVVGCLTKRDAIRAFFKYIGVKF